MRWRAQKEPKTVKEKRPFFWCARQSDTLLPPPLRHYDTVPAAKMKERTAPFASQMRVARLRLPQAPEGRGENEIYTS